MNGLVLMAAAGSRYFARARARASRWGSLGDYTERVVYTI